MPQDSASRRLCCRHSGEGSHNSAACCFQPLGLPQHTLPVLTASIHHGSAFLVGCAQTPLPPRDVSPGLGRLPSLAKASPQPPPGPRRLGLQGSRGLPGVGGKQGSWFGGDGSHAV